MMINGLFRRIGRTTQDMGYEFFYRYITLNGTKFLKKHKHYAMICLCVHEQYEKEGAYLEALYMLENTGLSG